FALTAGTAFSERLGMPVVVGCALAAVTFNFLLTYGLARWALRPLVEKLVVRFGYKLPEVEAGDSADLVLILRLTPGIPFFVQNYLSGLAEVNFRKYALLSCLIVWPFNAAVVVFSDAVIHGRGRLAITAGMLLVAVGAATHLARKHYAKKTPPPAA
ncbi:MAG: VTT domain-containing protein, partial [Pseudomonadota bacterium]